LRRGAGEVDLGATASHFDAHANSERGVADAVAVEEVLRAEDAVWQFAKGCAHHLRGIVEQVTAVGGNLAGAILRDNLSHPAFARSAGGDLG